MLLLIGAVSVVSPVVPSEALTPSHRVIDDKTGDAPAQVDITRLRVSLTSKRLQATFHVRDLARKRRSSYWIGGDFFAGYPDLWLITWKDKSGAVVTDLRAGEDGFRRHCTKARGNWNYKKDFVRVSFPQGCKGYTFSDGKFSASTEMGSSFDGVPDFKLAATKVAAGRGSSMVAPPPVTWSGWQGVKFDTKLTAAHAQLGGTLTRSATPYGCGDVLTLTNGGMDGNVFRHPHRVGNIYVWGKVAYPLGIRSTMTPAKIKKIVRQSKFTLRTRRYDPYGTGTYDYHSWVVGPKGHAFYFAYSDGGDSAFRMGLAATSKVARRQMNMNGC